jgi:hypothetical protein
MKLDGVRSAAEAAGVFVMANADRTIASSVDAQAAPPLGPRL